MFRRNASRPENGSRLSGSRAFASLVVSLRLTAFTSVGELRNVALVSISEKSQCISIGTF